MAPAGPCWGFVLLCDPLSKLRPRKPGVCKCVRRNGYAGDFQPWSPEPRPWRAQGRDRPKDKFRVTVVPKQEKQQKRGRV